MDESSDLLRLVLCERSPEKSRQGSNGHGAGVASTMEANNILIMKWCNVDLMSAARIFTSCSC